VKDMYISGGENVYPAEIENILYEMREIHEVAVIGLADPKWGEAGCAVVVPVEGADITLAAVRAHCGERLARFKLPARIEIVDALPRNATGKVLKFELRAKFS
jgi:fatty-acyl-CoA synthase